MSVGWVKPTRHAVSTVHPSANVATRGLSPTLPMLTLTLPQETLNNGGPGILQKMPAPARPMVGASATVHLIDTLHVFPTTPYLVVVAQAPTRPGAGIFCNPHG